MYYFLINFKVVGMYHFIPIHESFCDGNIVMSIVYYKVFLLLSYTHASIKNYYVYYLF